jgi:hypothetical protein
MSDDDRGIFPLLECLTSLAQALGQGFAPFAEATFRRCLHIVEATMLAHQRAEQAQQQGMDAEYPDKEFVSCALDLLSGLAEGLGGSLEALVGSSNILALLHACMQDEDPEGNADARTCMTPNAQFCCCCCCCDSLLHACGTWCCSLSLPRPVLTLLPLLSAAVCFCVAGRRGKELYGAPHAALTKILARGGGQP